MLILTSPPPVSGAPFVPSSDCGKESHNPTSPRCKFAPQIADNFEAVGKETTSPDIGAAAVGGEDEGDEAI